MTSSSLNKILQSSTMVIFVAVCIPGAESAACDPFCAGKCNDEGKCIGYCKTGYFSSPCTSCSTYMWGRNCKNNCGACGGKGYCNHITGVCDEDYCKPTYNYSASRMCTKLCTSPCKLVCPGNCGGLGKCSTKNGACLEGCKKGFDFAKSEFCVDLCDDPNCVTAPGTTCSSRCGGTGKCDKEGKCTGGCKSEYNFTASPYCTVMNNPGQGRPSFSKCSENCRGEGECDEATKECKEGCAKGYQPPYCHDKCKSPKYGDKCSKVCDKCIADNTSSVLPCDHVKGICNIGCKGGRSGENCKETDSEGFDTTDITLIVGVILVLILLVVGLSFLACRYRRQEKKHKEVRKVTSDGTSGGPSGVDERISDQTAETPTEYTGTSFYTETDDSSV